MPQLSPPLPVSPSLCPEEFAYLIPTDTKTLIELSEKGNGPNRDLDKYFLLGFTPKKGFAITLEKSYCDPERAESCELSLAEVDAIKAKMRHLSFVVQRDVMGCDGSNGKLRFHFPALHFVDLRWKISPHRSWDCIFDLIKEIEGMIANSPAKKICTPKSKKQPRRQGR